jgi:hypothetical protein
MTTIIAAVLFIAVLATAGRLALSLFRHARYLLEVRQLPSVSEWQARQNAAPLSSAIMERHVLDPDRGDN